MRLTGVKPMITMKDIIRDGHPTLRKVAKEVPLPPSKEDIETGKLLMEYVQNSQNEEIAARYGLRPGVGLAAPQINVSKRIIAVHFEDYSGKTYSHILFNPKIISHSVEKAYLVSGEGCLSVDEDIPGYVPRYARITVEAYDEEGKKLRLRLKEYAAIVFQHEIDHLNGILFYDHIDKENPFKPIDNAIPVGQ
jgi:peptide deformylase